MCEMYCWLYICFTCGRCNMSSINKTSTRVVANLKKVQLRFLNNLHFYSIAFVAKEMWWSIHISSTGEFNTTEKIDLKPFFSLDFQQKTSALRIPIFCVGWNSLNLIEVTAKNGMKAKYMLSNWSSSHILQFFLNCHRRWELLNIVLNKCSIAHVWFIIYRSRH